MPPPPPSSFSGHATVLDGDTDDDGNDYVTDYY